MRELLVYIVDVLYAFYLNGVWADVSPYAFCLGLLAFFVLLTYLSKKG